jgi:predicted small metal-binding protein
MRHAKVGTNMTRVLACRDIGFDCGAEMRGETDEELTAQVAEHAKAVHGMEEITPETMAKVQAAIRTA